MKKFYLLITLTLLSCTSNHFKIDKDPLHSEALGSFNNSLNNVEFFGSERPSQEVVHLGSKLFFDTRLSKDGTVSCARCHLPQFHFTDTLTKSRGTENRQAPRNAQTLINTAGQISQHWDGNREDVEEQAIRSFTLAVPYNLKDHSELKDKLLEHQYSADFKSAFKKNLAEISPDEAAELAAKSIGAYERTLVGPGRFDDYLDGNVTVLNTKERRGLKKFIEIGCAGCHSGQLIGGEMYQKFGVANDPYPLTGSTKRDLGRYDVTKDEDDKEVFKVPPLRNVTKTAPYFHDGSVETLDEAIYIMGKVQLDVEIGAQDREDIQAFLKTLETKESVLKKLTRVPSY